MIMTKAFIKEVPSTGDNLFKVEVPLMEDNTGTEAIFDALLCAPPESYHGYKVGDCVFIDFEDDNCNTAIILGKLYTDVPRETSAYNLLNELKVTGAATLPPNTRFGDFTAQDFINLYNKDGGAGLDMGDGTWGYVKWYATERFNSEGDSEFPDGYYYNYFFDRVRVMSGEEYDELWSKEYMMDELDDMNNTMYFLTSPPPSEAELEEEYAPRDSWS